MEPFRLEITAKNIAKAVRNSATGCAIVLALRAKRFTSVVVCNPIEFIHRGKEYRAEISKAASNFMDRFDAGKPVKPFSFMVKPVLVEPRKNFA